MDHQQFMQYLTKSAKRDASFTPEARIYKNAAGIDVMIQMPKSYWHNVDWLEERGYINFVDWVIDCDLNPTEGSTLSSDLMYWLWHDECERHRQGLPTPTGVPPEGFVPDGVVANNV